MDFEAELQTALQKAKPRLLAFQQRMQTAISNSTINLKDKTNPTVHLNILQETTLHPLLEQISGMDVLVDTLINAYNIYANNYGNVKTISEVDYGMLLKLQGREKFIYQEAMRLVDLDVLRSSLIETSSIAALSHEAQKEIITKKLEYLTNYSAPLSTGMALLILGETGLRDKLSNVTDNLRTKHNCSRETSTMTLILLLAVLEEMIIDKDTLQLENL